MDTGIADIASIEMEWIIVILHMKLLKLSMYDFLFCITGLRHKSKNSENAVVPQFKTIGLHGTFWLQLMNFGWEVHITRVTGFLALIVKNLSSFFCNDIYI